MVDIVEDMLDALSEASRAQLTLAEHHRVKADEAAQRQDRVLLSYHSTLSEKSRHAAHVIRMCLDHQQAIVDRQRGEEKADG